MASSISLRSPLGQSIPLTVTSSMAPPVLLFASFAFFIFYQSASATAAITLHLRPLASRIRTSISDQWEEVEVLASLATSSVARAHQLKRPKKVDLSPSNAAAAASAASHPVNLLLSSHSFGGYTVDLSFGTPPQTMTFLLDTGSSLVWSPCTAHYKCSRCNFPDIDPTKIPTFIPRASSSSRLIGCRNPKCQLLFGPTVTSQCPSCGPTSRNCSQICPVYMIQYGSGSTGGILVSDTISLPGQTVPSFLLGCSVFSSAQPTGIAGFGRGAESLPAQLGLRKFSYCLLSRKFDDTSETSSLVLDMDSGKSSSGLSYTPFRQNPSGSAAAFSEYYYVGLRKILVGGKTVKVPYRYLAPGTDGAGGTIVDSGTTFTFMEQPIFEAVAKEFNQQMGNYRRAKDVESRSGLTPCYNVSGRSHLGLPELVLQFKGGAIMALPPENYFAVLGSGVVCLTIVSDSMTLSGVSGGPAIVLGSFQQQNYYMEYDLHNGRLGFRKDSCK
ncbi:hypothetical protein SAY87_024099 [Trapa incisa]|uniref:Peptidase A1 domain-containing protein n=1 Tax=Trapa incisa TaxID=236973 RepID=A0AAN7L4K6_9MYRT|nr:hypothetical protein SAY87_024099 [Trapa incisa]